MNIQEIRAKYPQYDDMSDEQLANGLHKKFYSDMPIDDFYSRIGFAGTKPTKPTARVAGEDEGDFMRGISNIPGQIQNVYGAGKVLTGLVANKLGAKDTGKSLIQSGIESMGEGESKQVVKESDEFLKAWEKGIGTVVTDWLPYQIGSGAGNIAETLAFMGIGAVGASAPGAIAGALSKSLVKTGLKEAAEKVAKEEGKEAASKFVANQTKSFLTSRGATAGMVGQAGFHGAGETTGRAVEEAEKRGEKVEDIELSRILPAAAVHATADFFINKIGIDALGVSAKSLNSLALEIGKRIAITGTKELPAEEIQTMAERYGAKLSLNDAEAMREYINTAAASYGMSVAPGGVGGVRSHMAGQREKALKKFIEGQKEQTGQITTDTTTPPPADEDFQYDADTTAALDKIRNRNVAATDVEAEVEAENAPATTANTEWEDKAAKYMAEIDGGKVAQPGYLGQLLNKLGIERPTKGKEKGFKEKSIAAIKEHLARKSAVATESVSDTDRTSTELAASTSTEQPATGDATVTKPGRVVSDGTTTTAAPAGKEQQPATLETMKPGQQVTLYRGENAENTAGGQWWTTDKTKAEKFGKVSEITLPSEVIGQHAAMGHNNPNEFVFTGKKPNELVNQPTAKTPEVTPEITARRERVGEMIADGKTEGRAFKTALANLNKLEKEAGLPPTTVNALEARSDDEVLTDAMKVMQEQERREKEEFDAAYDESLNWRNKEKGKEGQTDWQYDISKEDRDIYNETRETVNAEVEAHKKERTRLIAEEKAAKERLKEIQQQMDDLAEDAPESEVSKFDRLEQEAVDAVAAAKRAVEILGPQAHAMPSWDDLSPNMKDVYFGNITSGPRDEKGRLTFGSSRREHAKAAKALQKYRGEIGGREKEQRSNEEERIILHYEEARFEQSKLFNVNFPPWKQLTAAQRKAYLQEIITNGGIQQNIGFGALAEKLTEQNTELTPEQKSIALKNIARRRLDQKQFVKKAKALADLQESNRTKVEGKNKTRLPDNIIRMIQGNNLQGVLQYLRSRPLDKFSPPYRRISNAIANSLFGMKLNTKIEIVPTLDGGLAMYDPFSDTIYVTEAGLSESTIIHEVVHAGTVKVIETFLYGNKATLTPGQIAACEQLETIMKETRSELIERYPNAYKNLFEFVSYALTNSAMQEDLHDLSAEFHMAGKAANKLYNLFELQVGPPSKQFAENIETILPGEKSKWSEFKLTVAGILKVAKSYLRGSKLQRNVDVNFPMEIMAAFDDILAVPEGGIVLPKDEKLFEKENKQAPGIKPITLDSKKDGFEESVKEEKPAQLNYIAKLFTTVPGLRHIASMFANNRYVVKAWEATHEMSKQIYHVGKEKMNNIYTQLTLSASQARNLYTQYVGTHAEDLNAAIGEFARLTGDNTEDAIVKLHKILEALHEPERRFMLYMLSVPLRETKKVGETMSPADVRVEISKLLDTRKLKEKEIKDLRNELEELIFTKDANGQFVLDAKGDRVPNMSNVDPLGSSPRITSEKLAKVKAKQPKLDMLNINSSMYQVSVLSPNDNFNSAKDIVAEYEKHEHKDAIDKIIKSIQELHKATTALNKMANYWSQPVDNRVKFYGFENYIPMKGYSHNKKEEMLSFDTMRRGKELQELDYAYDGRSTVGKNPILQTLSDATRSALRAGRRDLTLAIRNAIQQGLIEGRVFDPITFEQRQDPNVLKELPRENTVFHYNEDGSIQVLQIYNKEMRESIRRTYEQSKPIVELANRVTSGIGAMHTRYNYSFAPMNFVRDALTNAFAIGADMGPAEAANFIKAITGQVVGGNGLYKAMRVASMYQSIDKKDQMALAQMAKDDPYIAQMVEFIEKGGMVSYLQGLALKSNFQALHKEIGQSGIVKSKEQLDKFVDIWTDMFELASRSAAFGITKKNELGKLQQQVKDGKMTQKEAEETATIKAAAYAKNLANFEQVGSLGRSMGAFYMFFRPAATGAVRAIESLAPAFPGSLERAIANLPPTVTGNPEALAEFKKNYAEKQAHARIMTTGLIGMGSMAYLMAMMMSDDDELGRNAVLNDNMQQWTRFARFHIPREITQSMGIKDPVVIQIPWGFGMGAFAAAGAQLTGAALGKTSVKEALANVFLQISLDSFVPLPISKMPPTEMPLEFFLDSIAPSVARPILEFALNKNGLGQDIYNDQNRRFGDAYTGGDKVPEIYKDAARAMANSTLGEIDISPNTLYFLANSYLDGASRVFEAGYGITDLAQGRKGFNPKTDLPLFGSFFGAKSNVDSREFSAVEKKIQTIESKVKMFDSNPEIQAQYMAANPFDALIVDMYNKDINGELKSLRSQAKQIRLMQGLAPSERDAMLKVITFQQNLVKHNLIEKYKAYGISP